MIHKVKIQLIYKDMVTKAREQSCLFLNGAPKAIDDYSFEYTFLLNIDTPNLTKSARKRFIEAYGQDMDFDAFRVLKISNATGP